MLARINPRVEKGDRDGNTANLMSSVNRFFPGMLQKMMPNVEEAEKFRAELRAKHPELPEEDLPHVMQVPEEMRIAIGLFAKKFGKAMYYREVKNPFSKEGGMAFHFTTNAALLKHGRYPVLELLAGLAGEVPQLERNGNDLSDQMSCKLSFTENKDLFVVQAVFGAGFSLVLLGSPIKDTVENLMRRVSEKTGKSGPFDLLP